MLIRTTRILLAAFILIAGSVALAGPASAAIVSHVEDGITFEADTATGNATVTAYDPGVGGVDVDIPGTIGVGGDSYTVTAIGDQAFDNKGLISVSIPNSVTTIGLKAFNRNSLTTVDLPDNLTSVADQAFDDNDLISVNIPNSVTTIGLKAFYLSNITTIDLPDNLTSIGDQAFDNNELTTVTIPDSVTTIGAKAFYSNHLTNVTFTGPPPTTITDAGPNESMGTTAGLIVAFDPAYGSPTYPGGFTYPTWHGYNTSALVTVSFDLNGHGAAIADQNIPTGATVSEPTPPTATGWTFTGWYTDPGHTTEYDFSTLLTGDLTLYAGWTAVVIVDPDPDPDPDPGTGSGSGGSDPDDNSALPDTGSPITAPLLAAALASLGAGLILIRRRKA